MVDLVAESSIGLDEERRRRQFRSWNRPSSSRSSCVKRLDAAVSLHLLLAAAAANVFRHSEAVHQFSSFAILLVVAGDGGGACSTVVSFF
ncbi:unnamed protein product [Sphagnum jensenii]|uniref:Uncharacterized protein n=1 Tax=Sphagnum jensenii TaxID=128206 RepID=A0ABP1BD52_9BRYO